MTKKKTGPAPLAIVDRFLKFVSPEPMSGCWLWTGGADVYGTFYLSREVRLIGAHRASWQLFRGVIPTGLLVLHKCDTPLCVNPDHLFLGTNEDNSDDKLAKGRAPYGDRNSSRKHPERLPRGEDHHGAKLTLAQVRDIRGRHKAGTRQCKLAVEFGVGFMTISQIVKRHTWAWDTEGGEA